MAVVEAWRQTKNGAKWAEILGGLNLGGESHAYFGTKVWHAVKKPRP